MPPWKIDRVRQQLRGWTADGVARAHSVVADTDAQGEGEGASPGYALELAITEIVGCRSRGWPRARPGGGGEGGGGPGAPRLWGAALHLRGALGGRGLSGG